MPLPIGGGGLKQVPHLHHLPVAEMMKVRRYVV